MEENTEGKNQHGVAICVKTNLIKRGSISEPTCIDERIMHMDIIENKTKYSYAVMPQPMLIVKHLKIFSMENYILSYKLYQNRMESC